MNRNGPLRVVLIGGECSGKTTLAPLLAGRYDTAWVPEFVRTYAGAKGAPLCYADVDAIARGQRLAEDEGARLAGGVVIFDTNLLLTHLFSLYYYEQSPAWVEKALLERRYDLYLVAKGDFAWKEDPGQRDGAHVRADMEARVLDELDRRGDAYVVLSGSVEERLRTATDAINRKLRSAG